jgi:hypothetical protein
MGETGGGSTMGLISVWEAKLERAMSVVSPIKMEKNASLLRSV